MEFPLEGKEFLEAMDPIIARAQLTIHRDPCLMVDKKQGTIWLSLHKSYRECILYIVRYFTCEVRHSYLHVVKVKFLNCLKHDSNPLMFHIFCITLY